MSWRTESQGCQQRHHRESVGRTRFRSGVTRIGSRDHAVGLPSEVDRGGSAATGVEEGTAGHRESPPYKSPCEQYRSEDCPSNQRLQAVSKPTPNFETVF